MSPCEPPDRAAIGLSPLAAIHPAKPFANAQAQLGSSSVLTKADLRVHPQHLLLRVAQQNQPQGGVERVAAISSTRSSKASRFPADSSASSTDSSVSDSIFCASE